MPVMPPILAATIFANHLMKPDLFRAVAKLINPPIHTRVSQAPFSLITSSHSIAWRASIIPMHTSAIMVALKPVKEEVAHRPKARMNTPKTVFSSLLMGPMAANSLRAISGASGVSFSSGGNSL